MLEFAHKLNFEPGKMNPGDVEALRAAGFDVRGEERGGAAHAADCAAGALTRPCAGLPRPEGQNGLEPSKVKHEPL